MCIWGLVDLEVNKSVYLTCSLSEGAEFVLIQEAITKSLQGRFREFCRPYKPRQSSSGSSEPKESASAKSQSIMSTVPVPDGEDRFSFERHNRAPHLEHGKVHPNKQVVEELMTQSFAMRWNDLHDNSYGLDTVFEKYPFLADVSEVSRSSVCLYTFMMYTYHSI